MRTILMKFQGPFQSYGTDSHFETRRTDDHPSKGAVLGMIGAALGIRREETDRLQILRDLRMVIRVDQVGQVRKDYHTVAKVQKSGNYVTNRYYLEDAVFLVAIEGEEDLMERIYEALKRPYFPLFYGRRSCPLNYDFLLGICEGTALGKIEETPWLAADWYQKRLAKQEKIRLDVYGDEACMPDERQRSLRRDQPLSFSQMGRSHGLRFEKHKSLWVVNPTFVRKESETDHDAFSALMEGSYVLE